MDCKARELRQSASCLTIPASQFQPRRLPKAEYKKLAPNAELHASLVAAAIALAEHHSTAGTDKTWIKRLQNWIREERYLEDLPVPYVNAKEAAIARAKEGGPRKAKDTQAPNKAESPAEITPTQNGRAPPPAGLSSNTPKGKHAVEIADADVLFVRKHADDFLGETSLILHNRIIGGSHDGVKFTHMFVYGAENDEMREAARAMQFERAAELRDRIKRLKVLSLGL